MQPSLTTQTVPQPVPPHRQNTKAKDPWIGNTLPPPPRNYMEGGGDYTEGGGVEGDRLQDASSPSLHHLLTPQEHHKSSGTAD